MRLAVRLIVEEALEGKARDILGRDHYERRDGEQQGYRNGHREGEMQYGVPQLGDVDASSIQERHPTPDPCAL